MLRVTRDYVGGNVYVVQEFGEREGGWDAGEARRAGVVVQNADLSDFIVALVDLMGEKECVAFALKLDEVMRKRDAEQLGALRRSR